MRSFDAEFVMNELTANQLECGDVLPNVAHRCAVKPTLRVELLAGIPGTVSRLGTAAVTEDATHLWAVMPDRHEKRDIPAERWLRLFGTAAAAAAAAAGIATAPNTP